MSRYPVTFDDDDDYDDKDDIRDRIATDVGDDNVYSQFFVGRWVKQRLAADHEPHLDLDLDLVSGLTRIVDRHQVDFEQHSFERNLKQPDLFDHDDHDGDRR
ncbi:hypothetical protein JCM10212_006281 [Sporobolomyces blumeae]